MTRLAAVLGLAATLAVTAACSSSASSHHANPATSTNQASATAHAGQPITVYATDAFRFMPSNLDVRVGTVRIKLVEQGSYPHDFAVPALHVTSKTIDGNPGDGSTTLTLHFAHPGTYNFECTYHASAGMRGKIVVHA